MKTPIAGTCLLACCLLYNHAVLGMDTAQSPATALTASTDPQNVTSHVWVDASAGCLGGAALGTVLPGIGNIIGCIAGGASVWWLRRTPAL